MSRHLQILLVRTGAHKRGSKYRTIATLLSAPPPPSAATATFALGCRCSCQTVLVSTEVATAQLHMFLGSHAF